jgi:NADH-quinone oxidoreductase subunit G
VVTPAAMSAALAGLVVAALDGASADESVAALVQGINPTPEQSTVAQSLKQGAQRAIWLGALALRHAAYADLRALARELARLTGATLGELREGANAAGAYLAGAVPHRAAGLQARAKAGLNAREMLEKPRSAALLLNLEPWADGLQPQAMATLKASTLVVAVSAFDSPQLRAAAHVLLPAGTFAETSGTYVNLEGRWQSFSGAATPLGQSRPAWKILRVLGNLLDLKGFEFDSSEQVRDELKALVERAPAAQFASDYRAGTSTTAEALIDVPMYQLDPVLRRAGSLQRTRAGQAPAVIYPEG